MTKFLLYKERTSQKICIGKERASQQICIGRVTNFKFALLKAVVDRGRTFVKSAFILFGSLRLGFSIVALSTELYRIKVLPD